MTTFLRPHHIAVLAAVASLHCSKPSATGVATETGESVGAVPHSKAPAAPEPTLDAPPPPPPPAPSAAEPEPQAAVASAPTASASLAAKPAAGRPVKVVHIGMHIGGGPNDDVTKEPIRASVRPRFPELSACYAATGSKAESDFGVDLLIPAAGGKAQVSHPRSTLKGAPPELSTCIVAVFEGADFLKPLTGRTVVSYSMRFTP